MKPDPAPETPAKRRDRWPYVLLAVAVVAGLLAAFFGEALDLRPAL